MSVHDRGTRGAETRQLACRVRREYLRTDRAGKEREARD